MQRLAMFVDGSNLFGTLRDLNVEVDDYEPFFRYIYDQAVEAWLVTLHKSSPTPHMQLRRVYWYVVGAMDEWDLDEPKTREFLTKRFNWERDLRDSYMARAGEASPGVDQTEVARRAFEMWLEDFRTWYNGKREALSKMRRFYHAVRIATDFIDINEAGRWKVDFKNHSVSEKGVDTSLAVDMIRLKDNYDIAVVISGDADNIPSIRHMKTLDKHVAVVEFHKGYPPEARGRAFSSHLKLVADFVVHIYEMELVREGIAKRGSDETTREASADD